MEKIVIGPKIREVVNIDAARDQFGGVSAFVNQTSVDQLVVTVQFTAKHL